MNEYRIIETTDDVKDAIKKTTLPSPLGFGKAKTPIMASATYKDGTWGELVVGPYRALMLDPSAKCLHYGQEIFEGLKCYNNQGEIVLFRPEKNFERFNKSAQRLCMPTLPHELFMNAVASIAHHLRSLVPSGEGESLYIRPIMIATEPGLGLAAAKEYLFFVIATPSGAYFAKDQVHVLVERKDCRAAPGGTGAAKTAGNYAGSLNSLIAAQSLGFQQNIWLDARQMKYLEELSGMNFFALVEGELYTPALTDSILSGVTRQSVVDLAKDVGLKVHEQKIAIDELIEWIQDERCTEMFACGTAAVITPISALGEADGTLYKVRDAKGAVSRELFQKLVGIQRGRESAPHGWIVPIKAG